MADDDHVSVEEWSESEPSNGEDDQQPSDITPYVEAFERTPKLRKAARQHMKYCPPFFFMPG